MSEMAISQTQFHELVKPLIGLQVARVHEGYYQTVIFHLGQLSEKRYRNGKTILEGEASLMIEWNWRVERGSAIWFSSFSCLTKREQGLASLAGKPIVGITVEGRLPELSIQLTGDIWLKSFCLSEDQPQWTIFVNGTCLSSRDGELRLESK